MKTFIPVLTLFMIMSGPTAGFSDDHLEIKQKSRQEITVYNGNKEIAIHHSGEAIDKPYIHPLWTPDGRIVTYDAPADHVHHRAISVGWADLSNTDFWAEIFAPAGRRGRIVTRQLEHLKNPEGAAVIVEHNDWLREDDTCILSSIHTWTFLPPRGNLQIVDLDLRFTAREPEVVFGSDAGRPRPYHGLTLRAGPFDNPRYFNSNGDEGGEECMGKAAKWCAIEGIQSGAPVLAAILDSPKNDSHPTRFAIYHQGMQFISSSPNFSAPKVLKQNESWQLQYRVIAAGAPDTGDKWDLDSLWQEYASMSD